MWPQKDFASIAKVILPLWCLAHNIYIIVVSLSGFLQYSPQQCLLFMASSGGLQTKKLWLEQRVLPVRFIAVKWCGINVLSEGVFQSDFGFVFFFFFPKKDYFDVLRICWF